MRWTQRPDQSGVAFPKKKRVKKNKRASKPESDLQQIVNIKLSAQGIPYIRIPDSLLRSIFSGWYRIPPHVQADVSDHLAGWPDNMPILAVQFRGRFFWIVCPIELKTETGKLTPRQKERQREVSPFNIIKTQKEFDEMMDCFLEFHQSVE